MTDPVRQENMRLRAELTLLETRRAATEAEHAALRAYIDALTGSRAWRLAHTLIRAGERVPPVLRRSVRSALRGFRRTPAAVPEPAETAAIPSNALYFGLFTQDDTELAANPWYDEAAPRVSVIVLNWNRSAMTVACLRYVLRHTAGHRFEVLIADNGSRPAELAILRASGLPGRVIELQENLFFGEANNVAADQARGEYLFFLNNDAFVHDGWLEPLVRTIEELPAAGAVGSRLVFPDGTLQEAGALMSWDGIAHQLGKQADSADERFGSVRQVDYASAAALMLRRQDFLDVLGFDLCYEPAYFEDVDLCMKLRVRGKATYYCPGSVVTHVENATSLRTDHDLRLENIVETNRTTFVARWGDVLLGRPHDVEAVPPYAPSPRGRPRVMLYTPYLLTAGGGERYLLSIGQALAAVADVTLVGRTLFSASRLRRLGLDLRLDVSGIMLQTLEAAQAGPAFDLAFVMGNAVLPPLPAPARRSLYICQFPFPMTGTPAELAKLRPNWDGYERVIVYSEFARTHFETSRAAARLPPRPVQVVPPPVHLQPPGTGKRHSVLSVGRFFAGEHCKKQDLMVPAFRELAAARPGCTLHLAGSLRPEPLHRAYYLSIVQAAAGLPIVVHPNADAATLARLYAESRVYWHLTGFGSDTKRAPELSEHFGIAVVEAMSAGCVPVAFRSGGPADIITDGEDGYLVDDLEALVRRTQDLLTDPALAGRMGARAAAAARRYDDAVFAGAVQALAAPLLAG